MMNFISIKRLFRIIDEEIDLWQTCYEKADKLGEKSMADNYLGSIQALKDLKRELGYPKRKI